PTAQGQDQVLAVEEVADVAGVVGVEHDLSDGYSGPEQEHPAVVLVEAQQRRLDSLAREGRADDQWTVAGLERVAGRTEAQCAVDPELQRAVGEGPCRGPQQLALVAELGRDVEHDRGGAARLEVDLGRESASDHLLILEVHDVRDGFEPDAERVRVAHQGPDDHLEATTRPRRIEALDAGLTRYDLEDRRDDVGDLLRAPDLGTWCARAEQQHSDQQHARSQAKVALHVLTLSA